MSGASSGGGAKAKPTIVVKRIKKVAGGHHGGAWKIAYADFVTAMMAFFLLMWLLGSTTQGDLKGIAEFFQNPMKVSMSGGSGAGDATSVITGGGRDLTSTSGQVKRGQPTGDTHKNADAEALQAALEKQEAKEKAGLEDLKSKVTAALSKDAKLTEFMSQIRLDLTSEGLRIQIVDDQQRPMFDSGKAIMKPYMRDILREIAPVLNTVDNKITLLGHTDSVPFSTGEAGYSNWELSADRANASRRELIVGGLDESKTVRVAGLAASVPMLSDKPTDPQNRRISIIVMNKRAEDRFYNREPATAAAAAATGPRAELSPMEKFAAQSRASVAPIANTEH